MSATMLKRDINIFKLRTYTLLLLHSLQHFNLT